MQYVRDITFTKKGSATNQILRYLKCASGVIHKIEIVFPSGCFGLVHVQLFQGGHPIAPTTYAQTYSSDDEIVIIPEFYELFEVINELTIKGYNEDDTYNHTLQIRIYVLPKAVLVPAGATDGIIAGMRHIFVDRWKLEKPGEEE